MDEFKNILLPWPDWKIVKYLGGGTYGKVYEIERNISGFTEKAALKIISKPKDQEEIESYYDNGYDKESIIESFNSEMYNYVQEYKILKELQGQTNIVSCDDFTIVPNENGIGGKIFIRMELLIPLQQVLRERNLSEEEIVRLGKDLASALILCERKHVIHRDIKPANIMISQFGDFKLGDFGVSKIMDHATYATAMGTPDFQAPEVVHMEKYGHTADIYSLGITLYWLLNRRRMPFMDVDEKLTFDKKNKAIEMRYRGESLPAPECGTEELKKIVQKACAYKQEERYTSAQELYDALDGLKPGETTGKPKAEGWYSGTSMENQESGEGNTQGNSWGESFGTIGKAKAKQEQTNEKQQEFDTETIGGKADWKKSSFETVGQKKIDSGNVTQEEAEQKNQEKSEEPAVGYCCFFLFGFVFASFILMHLLEGFEAIRIIIKGISGSLPSTGNWDFLFYKAVYEFIIWMMALIGMIFSFVVVGNSVNNNKVKGIFLQIYTIIFLLVNLYEGSFLKSMDSTIDNTFGISQIIMIVICIIPVLQISYACRKKGRNSK